MATSTGRRYWPAIVGVLLAFWLAPAQVPAAQPVLGVPPLAYAVPTAGHGLADLLALCIADCGPWLSRRIEAPLIATDDGWWEGAAVEGCDYVLQGRITALCIADRDQESDLAADLGDLARALGLGGSIAQVSLDLELWSVPQRARITAWHVEAVESRKGTRLDPLTTGWLASADYGSDGFRQTMLGRATYKAIGGVLNHLIEVLPLTGQVLAVGGKTVVVDLGSSASIAVGDELVVLEAARIRAEDGEIAWWGERRIAAAQVLEVKEDRSLCLLLDADCAVTEGLSVRPVTAKYVLPAEAD